jgi:hypothetical protein
MRQNDDFGVRLLEFLQSRHQALKTRRVGNNSVLHRDVQVGAQQDDLVAKRKTVEREKT